MKARLVLVALVLVGGIGISSESDAALIVLNDIQNQVIDGENFNFDFLGAPPSDGAGGTLVLHAQGDYDGRDDETLSWDMEGIVSAGPVGGFNDVVNGMPPQGGPFDFVNVFQPLGNAEFQRTYAISGTDLDAILADGSVSIFVDLMDQVGLFDPPNYVEFTLTYNSAQAQAPEPATILLLGTMLVGVGLYRRQGRG